MTTPNDRLAENETLGDLMQETALLTLLRYLKDNMPDKLVWAEAIEQALAAFAASKVEDDELVERLRLLYESPREHLKRPSTIHIEEAELRFIITRLQSQSERWVKIEDSDKHSAQWGFSANWIDADWNISGVRSVNFDDESGQFKSWDWCPNCDTIHEGARDSQPTHVCTRFPIAPPKMEEG